MRRRLSLQGRSSQAVLASMPQLLDELIARVDALAGGRPIPQAREASELYGAHRAEQGFELSDVVFEHAILREVLHQQMPVDPEVWSWIDLAIDDAIAVAVEEFTREREREVRVLDRLAEVLRVSAVPELLERQLAILVEEIGSVEAGVLLLRDPGGLQVRAIQGPLEVDAQLQAHAQEVYDRREPSRRAVDGRIGYATPLIAGGELFGVACVVATRPLHRGERRLFQILTEHAAGAIAQQVLREEAEARLRAMQVAYEALEHGDAVYLLDEEARLVFVNGAAERLIGRPREQILGRVLWDEHVRIGRDGSPFRAALEQALQEQRPTRFEARQDDGVWLDVAAYPREGGGLAVFLRDITDRRRVEARAQIFQRLVDVHPDLFHVVDRDERLVWVSPSVLAVTGRPLDEVLGLTFAELGLQPEYAGTLRERLEQAFAGETVRGVGTHQSPDGPLRVYDYVFAPIPGEGGRIDLVAAVARDVTEQHARAEWDRLVAQVSQLIETLDVEQALTELPRRVVPALGEVCSILLAEEGRPVRWAGFADDPAKQARLEAILRAYRANPTLRGGLVDVIAGHGALLVPQISPERYDPGLPLREFTEALGVASYMAVPLQARDHILGAMSFASSNPGFFNEERFALAQEVANRAAIVLDNVRLMRDLERAVRSRDDVLAVVSHDLRNPLSAVRLSTQLLARSPHPPEALIRRTIEAIDRSTASMNRLISDLVDLASLQRGKLRMEPADQALSPVLEEAVERHLEAARAKGVHLEPELSLGDLRLRFDRDRLLQVLGNLLHNALRACGPGDRVVVRGQVDGDRVEIAVEDTGPGVPEGIRDQLFEPYGVMRKRSEGGTGLGLFISRGIVQAHGGSLELDSTPGPGARFTITLPRRPRS